MYSFHIIRRAKLSRVFRGTKTFYKSDLIARKDAKHRCVKRKLKRKFVPFRIMKQGFVPLCIHGIKYRWIDLNIDVPF